MLVSSQLLPFIKRALLPVIVTVSVLNIVALWIVFAAQYQKLSRQDALLRAFATNIVVPTPMPFEQNATPQVSQPTTSPDLQSLLNRISTLEQNVAALSQTKPQNTTKVVPSPSVKTAIIYLGSGSTISRDWTTQTSAAAPINLSDYPNIKEIRFEAAPAIIGGEAHVRLINLSTGGIFYNSEVSYNASPAVWVSSQPIYLPSGSAVYAVQLKSTSGEMAILTGARIRIMMK